MALSDDVAALEQAAAEGRLVGRDLEVIELQIKRAEAKVLKATQHSALLSPVRRSFLPAAA